VSENIARPNLGARMTLEGNSRCEKRLPKALARAKPPPGGRSACEAFLRVRSTPGGTIWPEAI